MNRIGIEGHNPLAARIDLEVCVRFEADIDPVLILAFANKSCIAVRALRKKRLYR